MRTFIVAVMLLMLFSVGRAQEPLPVPIEPREGAMAVSQVQKLAPPDAGKFGFSVDSTGNSEGDILVVGAPTTTVNSIAGAGAIFVYRMDAAGQWQFWQRVTVTPSTDASFGFSVSVTGSGSNARIAVGASNEAHRGYWDGRVYVFRIENDLWINEAALHDSTLPVSSFRENFGAAVALSDDGLTLAIGEPDAGSYSDGQSPGLVHVYERSGTQWALNALISPPDGGLTLGRRIEIVGSGNAALMAISSRSSGLYLFHRPQGIWQPLQKLAPGDSSWGTGTEFAIAGPPGQRLIAIAELGTYNGGVYIFRHNGSAWVQSRLLTSTLFPISAPSSYGHFGYQIALSGDASNAMLYAMIEGTYAPQWQRVLRINLTPSSATLQEQILSPEPDEVGFTGNLFVSPGAPNNSLIVASPNLSTGMLHIFGNEAGVQVSPGTITVIEGSLGTSYVVSLSKAPTADVTITADPADGCDVGAGVGQPVTRTLTAANWSSPQTITVQVPPDNAPEAGSICLITHSAASADVAYNGIAVSTVHASVYDPPMDLADIGLTDYDTVSVAEGGVSDSYRISLLSKPTSSVQVQALPDAQCDLGAGAGQAVGFVFTVATWQTPTTVTVMAADDALDEGTHTCLISHSVSGPAEYDGMSVPNVVALIADNDTPPVYLADITLTNHQNVAVTEGGAADSYSISLVYEPASPVQIQALPDAQCDLGAGAGQAVTFDYSVAAWQTPAVVTVSAADDALNEGTHQCVITHSVGGATEYAGLAVPNVTATITDNDAANLIANGDFESGTAPWKVKNKTGDKVLCDTATRSVAYAGSCAFKFKGGAGENALLTQITDLTGVTFGPSDAIRLQAMVSGGAAAKGKLKLRVLYGNGEDTVIKLALPTTGAYALTESAWVLLDSESVAAITVAIQHRSTKGKVWVDDVALWHRPVIVLRGVPEAAASADMDGFRAH